jgi:hypothetical protein
MSTLGRPNIQYVCILIAALLVVFCFTVITGQVGDLKPTITWGQLLNSVSIIVALLVFMAGYKERRSSDRRRRTFDFLVSIIEEEGPIRKANLEFAIWIRDNRVIEDDNVDDDDDRVIIALIDYYDLLSDSAMRGIIDQEMVILHLGGRMRSAYEMTEKYIRARRDTLKRPALYKPFEKFVTECVRDRSV